MENIADGANNPNPLGISFVKICSKCNETKQLTEFYKSEINRDGLLGYCKTCQIETVAARKKEKKLVSYGEISMYQKFWLAENRLKKKAHQAVSYAVQKGKLVRQPCERCGTNENVVAHHEDYSKPLDVVWLCKYHHKERHLEIDKETKEKPKADMINNPPHYTHGGIETIAYIRAKLSPEQYVGYLRGNIEKYNSRIGLKGDSTEDAGKIEWYAKELHRFLREG
jgi:hypothetical protein